MYRALIHFLLLAPSELDAPAPETTVASHSDALREAQTLHDEGVTLYETADYTSAIVKFTGALSLVMKEEDERIRAALLYNIARAHEKQFEIDKDVTHLRKAQTLYEQYLGFSEAVDNEEQQNVTLKVFELKSKIQEHERAAAAVVITEPQRSQRTPHPLPVPDSSWKRKRVAGISLSASGGAAVISGVALLAAGSQFESNAESQVSELDALNLPADHPAWYQGDQFIAQEKRKGNLLMAFGGALAVVGGATTGAGVFYLFKARRSRRDRLRASASLGRTFAGVQLSGHF